MSDDLAIGDLVIPEAELEWRFTTSGGPGGQHANRSSTRAELSFNLLVSPSVPGALRERMLERLGSRTRGGVVTVTVDESRSQWRNRVNARRRMAELLTDSMRQDRPRLSTKPSRAAKQRRLAVKRKRSELKRLRRKPFDID